MITLREEKLRMAPDIFVEKRDGRRVPFDVEKIYKALLKATEEVTSLTPVMEAKLEAIVDRVIAEILERFPNGVKIYEIQNVVEHELLQANEYAIAWHHRYLFESCSKHSPLAFQEAPTLWHLSSVFGSSFLHKGPRPRRSGQLSSPHTG